MIAGSVKANIYIINKPEPFAVLEATGILLGYYSKRTIIARDGEKSWSNWSERNHHFDSLGFIDGLQKEPVLDSGDGRLMLSGMSLYMLAKENAGQRTPQTTYDTPFGNLFYRKHDKIRALHYFNEILPAVLFPETVRALSDEDQQIVDAERQLRGPIWGEIAKYTDVSAAH